jgi:hypothetical protein
VRHLVARFFRSLRPIPPTRTDDEWVAGFLTPAEQALYAAMPTGDRRHAVDGARATAESVPEPFRTDAVEAALVHDVGKRHARLGVVGRSFATGIGWVVRGDARRTALAGRQGWLGRAGRYLRHDPVGAAEVEAAGGSPLAVAWTAGHHHRDAFSSLPAPAHVVAALDSADHAF